MKPIFHKGLPLIFRVLFFVLLGVAVLLVDSRSSWLKPVREGFLTVATPLYWVTGLPGRLWDWGDEALVSRSTLQAENMALRAENRILQQKLQKMATVIAENARLTELLNSSQVLEDDVLIARLLGVNPDPGRQEYLLDKGALDQVTVNQAVLDAHGVAGLITEVASGSSRLMLVTDSHSAIPVQVVRNGVRFVAEGTGHPDEMRLRHVSPTVDLQLEDVLVSSGLDGVYPANYPVAVVRQIEKNPNQPFLKVTVQPVARLQQSRHFLLVHKQPGPITDKLAP